MRVAIPVRNGAIFGHFGVAATFLLADVENGQVVKQVEIEIPEDSRHHGIPAILLEQGVTHVIAGGMGQPMLEHLTRSGLPTVTGASGSPADALAAFIAGTLKSDASAVHAHHGDHEHHHH